METKAMSTNKKTIPTYAEIATAINEGIKDKTLKEFLFGMVNLKESGVKGIGVIYKLIMFAFLFSLAKYKSDSKKKKLPSETANALRAMNALDCVYEGEDVNLDFIIYTLTEMQLDVTTHGKKSYFSSVFSNEENVSQIPVFRQLIKTWLTSADYAEKDEEVLRGLLWGLYHSLGVLQKIELREKDVQEGVSDADEIITYEIYYRPTRETIDATYFFKQIGSQFYYLTSYESIGSSEIRLLYTCVTAKNIQFQNVNKQEFYETMNFKRGVSVPKSVFAKSLDALDFKYIKNLALAVSDVITPAMKEKLNAHYSIRYSDVFELARREFNNIHEINWDNVLTILMFEEGPSNVLEFVLDSDGFCFERILKNLEIRYNNPSIVVEAKKFYEEEQQREMRVLKNYTDSYSSLVKNMVEINKILMAKAIINTLVKTEDKNKSSNACFVESLPMRIKHLTEIMTSRDSISGKVIAINHALEKTFRYIIPFYYGIIEYNKVKVQGMAALHTMAYSIKELEIKKRDVYKDAEEAFKKKAYQVAESLGTATLGSLERSFQELARCLVKKEGHVYTVQSEGINLQEAIGRSYICSLKGFEEIWKIEPGDIWDEYKGKVTNIANYINIVKHAKVGTGIASNIFFKDFVMKVKELFYFFIYNEDYRREMLLGEQVSYDPIYPYVVQYEARSENRDSCDISSFSVFITEDNVKKEIKILSDREYVINEKYYCIPNVTTSNSRWWIEPFLINCREYDELIAAATEKRKLTKLDKPRDTEADDEN